MGDVAVAELDLPGWVDLLGGRQSARTIHFVAAWLLVVFVAVHVFEVIVSGLWNQHAVDDHRPLSHRRRRRRR